jgi:uncharacterized circularly permuted ATP-grasp superfamily protein
MIKNQEKIENKPMDYDSYINSTGEEESEYQDMYDRMKESQKEEFLNWEDKVRDLYIKNFIPY